MESGTRLLILNALALLCDLRSSTLEPVRFIHIRPLIKKAIPSTSSLNHYPTVLRTLLYNTTICRLLSQQPRCSPSRTGLSWVSGNRNNIWSKTTLLTDVVTGGGTGIGLSTTPSLPLLRRSITQAAKRHPTNRNHWPANVFIKCTLKHWPPMEPKFTSPEDVKKCWKKVPASTDLQTRLALLGVKSFPLSWM
jgi:hypothetical protein